MKSASELALEKTGRFVAKTLTDQQKEKIANLRREADAKKAEFNLARDEKIKNGTSTEEYELNYMNELKKIDEKLEIKIEEIKKDNKVKNV